MQHLGLNRACRSGIQLEGPWTEWSFSAQGAGTYTVSYRVANALDSSVDAFALFDSADADVEMTAKFNVTKEFSNGDTGDVEVTLNCNGGLPLQQSFTISGGDPAGVTFTVDQPAGYRRRLRSDRERWQ